MFIFNVPPHPPVADPVVPSTPVARQSTPAPGGPHIPPRIINKAAPKANAIAGTNVQVTTNDQDITPGKVLVKPNIKTKTGKIAGTFPLIDLIVIFPDELERTVPGCTEPGNEDLLEELLVLILAHEFEHCSGGSGGHNVPDKNPDETESCRHLQEYKDDGIRACNRMHQIATNPDVSLETRCRLTAGLCKFHGTLKKFNTSENSAAALACDPAIAIPVVSDCAHCPDPGLECPIHHHVY